jgi:hypothetical protein
MDLHDAGSTATSATRCASSKPSTTNTGRTALSGRRLRFDHFRIPTPAPVESHRSTSADKIDLVMC